MKFIIATSELSYLLNKCQNVVSQKATIPILSNFLIEAVGGEIILTATDLTVGVRCHTEAKVIEEGSVAVPARYFGQLIRELTSANVEISSSANDIVEIVADTSRFKINGMNKSEYPELPDISDSVQVRIKEKDLKEMFYRTGFSVSKEDNRYALTGVFLKIQEGIATFAGTDGKRLSRSFTPVQVDKSFRGSYIIPYKAVDELLKNLSDSDDEVGLFLLEDKLALETGNARVITKLLTGDYPDINRIIPEKAETTVSLHRDELISLLRQVSLFTIDVTQSVRFTFSNGEVKLAANTSEIGEGRVSMPANYTGEKLEIAFNPIYFLDVLRHSKEETVSLCLSDSYSPGVITDQQNVPISPQAANPLFVLMPMRLNEE